MKCEEFGMKTLFDALKHQWKRTVIVVLIFALVGVGAGVAFAHKGVSENAGEADAFPTVALSDVAMDANYYTSCLSYLKKHCDLAVTYKHEFAVRGNLTLAQQEKVSALHLELTNFSNDVLGGIEEKFSTAGAVYVPQAFYEQYVAQCQQQLDASRQQLALAQTAVELLDQVDSAQTQADTAATDYKTLAAAAAAVLEYTQQVQKYEAQLVTLQDQSGVQQAEAQIQQLLQDAVDGFNDITKRLSVEIYTIAKENNILYDILADGTSAMRFVLRHTHTISTVEESFVLIVLFCTLTGICAGLFFALYTECKKQKQTA